MRRFSLYLPAVICSLLFILAYADHATAETVLSVRPAEKTALRFDQQVASVETQSRKNLKLNIVNMENFGFVFVTPTETFSTGSMHVIFQDGSLQTLTLITDPTADLQQHVSHTRFEGPDFMDSPEGNTFTVPDAPTETKGILYLLNNLENATVVWIRYEKPLPPGIQANVTRVVDNSKKYVYEVEVVNTTSRAIALRASMFADYLTEAVSIAGMDQHGSYVIRPGEKNFVYISELREK